MRGRGAALLVDDEEGVRLSTADMLADLGYDVIEAASAEEALRLLANGAQVHFVISDHLMPGMSAADFAQAVRERYPDLAVLIVSGYADVDASPESAAAHEAVPEGRTRGEPRGADATQAKRRARAI